MISEIWHPMEFEVPAMSVPVYTRNKQTGKKVKKTDEQGRVVTTARIIAKERPRFSSKSRVVYSPANTTAFEKWVRRHFFQALPGNCGVYYKGKPWPVHHTFFGCQRYSEETPCDKYRKGRDFLDCQVCTHRRKNLRLDLAVFLKSERHIDLDNIVKIVLDSLNKVCFYDDSQFMVKYVEAFPYAKEEKLRVKISVLPTMFKSDAGLVGGYAISKLSEKDALTYISNICGAFGMSFYDYLLRCDNRKFIKEFVRAKTNNNSGQ